MNSVREQLGPDDFEKMMRGIVQGKYNLLLGAGASASSTDKNGANLPMSGQLGQDLASAFNIPDAADKPLGEIYEFAMNISSDKGPSVSRYLKSRLTGVNPHPWLLKIFRARWENIWTLNIDDSIEVANTSSGLSAMQSVKSISWAEPYAEAKLYQNEVLVIHLHGKASRAHKEGELIFDIAEYLNSVLSKHRWHAIFNDTFPAKPFIVIGATLNAEIDIKSTLNRARLDPSGLPSILVLPNIDGFQRATYERYGLFPIESTGEELIDEIHAALPEYTARVFGEDAALEVVPDSSILRFAHQWTALEMTATAVDPRKHDLYSGHEPRWIDALKNRLSSRSAGDSVIRRIECSILRGGSSIEFLHGGAFSGKSSEILRISHSLSLKNFTVALFNEQEAIDSESVIGWLKKHPMSLLVVDNAGEFGRDIRNIYSLAQKLGVKINILISDRNYRKGHINKSLSGIPVKETEIRDRLSQDESRNLQNKLREQRRLGILTNSNASEIDRYFRENDFKLLDVMAKLEDGRGFKTRIADELANVKSKDASMLVSSISIVSSLGLHVPSDLAAKVSGLSTRRVIELMNGSLVDLIVQDERGFKTRHRILGELIVNQLSAEDQFDHVVRVAQAVAPFVSPAAIVHSTVYYRIAKLLMDFESLKERLDSNFGLLYRFYQELEESFEWNARYWEQRALFAADFGNFEEGISWAEQAISSHSDAFSLTTAGKVMMSRALHEAGGGHWPTVSFEKAETYLAEARELEGVSAEYPYQILFKYLIRILELVPEIDEGLEIQLRSIWMNWFNSMLALDESTRDRLKGTRSEALSAFNHYFPGGAGQL